MSSPIILAQNLVKWYGPRVAVRDVSFAVSEGEVVGLLGPNGSGKSTIFRILTGYLTPSSGTASVAGLDVRTESLALRHHVGYVPEDAPLYHHMRVLEFLRFMARLKGLSGRVVNRAVEAAAARLQLEKVLNLTISKLSRGYRQRVAIAQALLNEPKLLVLDEPTSGLDPGQVIAVRDLIRELAGRQTVLIASHVLTEIEQIANRVMILLDGRLLTTDALTLGVQTAHEVGYVPEDAPLYDHMRVVEFLRFMGAAQGHFGGARSAVRSRLPPRGCSSSGFSDMPIAKLSRGYRQRVAIAQALLNEPKLLVLDEPTSGLDPSQVIAVRDLIREHRRPADGADRLARAHGDRADRQSRDDLARRQAADGRRARRKALRTQRLRLQVAGTEQAVRDCIGAVPGVRSITIDNAASAGPARYLVDAIRARSSPRNSLPRSSGTAWRFASWPPLPPDLERIFLDLTRHPQEVAA